MKLRPYQAAALSALWDYLRCADGNPALVLPTGAGKSPLMAAIASEAVQNWGGRIGVLAHVQELVEQNSEKLRAYWPQAPMGIYAAGLKRRDRFDPILFMQIQSVAKRAHELGRFDLLLIDEAHRVPLKDDGLYRQFIADCRRFNPHLRIVGLTATPYRLQGAAVPVCGPENILTEIAYEARVADLIADGYLSRLVSKAGDTPDLSGVHMRGGEYVEGELADAMMKLVARTVPDILARAVGRRAGIVFCVNVAHAQAVMEALYREGETAALVHGGTPKGERAALIESFQRGALRWMVNVNVLSEGFDAPHIDCVAMLRPTKSPGLYYQQVGRGFRLAPGKDDCLVLDYAGNVLEHGPVDAIKVQSARPGKAAAVVTGKSKKCPTCDEVVPVGTRVCPNEDCGHTWVSADPTHLDRPVNAPILSTDRPRVVNTHVVRDVGYARHIGKSGIPTLRVTYHSGLRRFNEYVCLQHAGVARAKALRWWMERTDATCPRSVEEAMASVFGLRRPARIVVDETGKWPEIVSVEWGEAAEQAEAQPPATNAPEWLAHAIRRTA